MYFRVEIIRLSDKSFKETIKDVELSTYRSTTKEGYVSLDPSKPLPHEFEEGKLSRYNDNLRQKDVAGVNTEIGHNPNENIQNDNDSEALAQFSNVSDSNVILNKTEFREILMNALSDNNNVTSPINLDKFDNNNKSDANEIDDNINENVNQLNGMNGPEIGISHDNLILSIDDAVNSNETFEKISTPSLIDTTETSTNPIILETPEVDKLLNGGNKLTIHSGYPKEIVAQNFWKQRIGNEHMLNFILNLSNRTSGRQCFTPFDIFFSYIIQTRQFTMKFYLIFSLARRKLHR